MHICLYNRRYHGEFRLSELIFVPGSIDASKNMLLCVQEKGPLSLSGNSHCNRCMSGLHLETLLEHYTFYGSLFQKKLLTRSW